MHVVEEKRRHLEHLWDATIDAKQDLLMAMLAC
jgi:hypothetical protein